MPRRKGFLVNSAPGVIAVGGTLLFMFLSLRLDAAERSASAAEKPNILILLADDLGYADVGFNGGQTIATQNLDRLAATGWHTHHAFNPWMTALFIWGSVIPNGI